MDTRASFSIAVDIVIFSSDQKVLLIKRKNDPFKDCWAFPGGFVDEGETFGRAAVRELREETGIDMNNLTFIGMRDEVDRDPRGRVIGVSYGGRINIDSSMVGAKAADDAKEIGWFLIDNIYDKKAKLAFDHQYIFYETYERLLK